VTGGLVQIPVNIDKSLGVPIQEQLANGIRELILEGTLKPDMRLPATRAMSRQLNVSRNTVKNAYLNLASQGYLKSKGTAGTFVCERVPDFEISALVADSHPSSNPQQVGNKHLETNYMPFFSPHLGGDFDFSLANSNPNIAAERTWRRLLLHQLPYRSRHANKMEPAGLRVLREAISHAVSPLRGMSFNPENCFIVCDDFRAFDIVCSAVLSSGTRAIVESPCDSGIVYMLRRLGIEPIPAPIDEHGVVVKSFPLEDVKLAIVSPSHQIPSAATMSLARRKALLDWAEKANCYILEWDTFGEFSYDDVPIQSLYSLDKNNRVIYLNCFSTWIGGGLKLGYLVVPEQLKDAVNRSIRVLNPVTPWLDQRVTTDFILSKGFFGHLRKVRQTLRSRRDVLINALLKHGDERNVSGYQAGRHLVWRLPTSSPSALELKREADQRLISLTTLHDDQFQTFDTMHPIHDPDHTVFLNYSGLLEEQIAEGIALLSESW